MMGANTELRVHSFKQHYLRGCALTAIEHFSDAHGPRCLHRCQAQMTLKHTLSCNIAQRKVSLIRFS